VSRFRPCIDLHGGRVKQIVGATLRDRGGGPETHFVSDRPAAWYARLYRCDGLTGGHVIMLGPGNEEAAAAALEAFPGGLQIGGGITADNAREWLDRGAAAVIVTSWVFHSGGVDLERLRDLSRRTGRDRLVLDLSCRCIGGRYVVMTDRWQRASDVAVCRESLEMLAEYAFEFLVHAVDVEGRRAGIDADLVRLLADASPIPCTYAGGIRSMADVQRIAELSGGRLDFTVGRALDIFGGTGVRYRDLVEWNRQQTAGDGDAPEDAGRKGAGR